MTHMRREKRRFARRLGSSTKSGMVNTSTIETTRNQNLFVTQRNHWVYLRGPPRRNETSQQRCPNEEQCHPAESQRIGGSDAKEQRLHGTRQRQRPGNPHRHPDEDRPQSLAQAPPQHVAGRRAESGTHAKFAPAAAVPRGAPTTHTPRPSQPR